MPADILSAFFIFTLLFTLQIVCKKTVRKCIGEALHSEPLVIADYFGVLGILANSQARLLLHKKHIFDL